MADKFDDIMTTIANEANASIDYSAMREAILKKSEAKKRKQSASVIRYGSIAAAVALMLGIGTFIARGGLGAKSAAPQSQEMLMAESAAVTEGAPAAMDEGAPREAPAAAPASGASPEDAANDTVAGAANDAATYSGGESDISDGEMNSFGLNPELPVLCAGCEVFGWEEASFELPEITFGDGFEIESSDVGFLCTAKGCTEEDFAEYIAGLEDWYLTDDMPRAAMAPGWPRVYTLLADGWCQLRLELTEDGTMTIAASTSEDIAAE